MACQFNLVLYGPVDTGKTHLAVASGRLACMRVIPAGFFHRDRAAHAAARNGGGSTRSSAIAKGEAPHGHRRVRLHAIDRTVRHGRLTGFEGGSYRSEHALMTR